MNTSIKVSHWPWDSPHPPLQNTCSYVVTTYRSRYMYMYCEVQHLLTCTYMVVNTKTVTAWCYCTLHTHHCLMEDLPPTPTPREKSHMKPCLQHCDHTYTSWGGIHVCIYACIGIYVLPRFLHQAPNYFHNFRVIPLAHTNI